MHSGIRCAPAPHRRPRPGTQPDNMPGSGRRTVRRYAGRGLRLNRPTVPSESDHSTQLKTAPRNTRSIRHLSKLVGLKRIRRVQNVRSGTTTTPNGKASPRHRFKLIPVVSASRSPWSALAGPYCVVPQSGLCDILEYSRSGHDTVEGQQRSLSETAAPFAALTLFRCPVIKIWD